MIVSLHRRPIGSLRSYLPKDHPDKAKEIGSEPTFKEYLDKMMLIFAEVKRVLKPTGSFWLDMGDSYGANFRGGGVETASKIQKGNKGTIDFMGMSGKAEKSLIGQPWRMAIRMIDEQGWILRADINWIKQILVYKKDKKYTMGAVMPSCLSPQTEVYIKDEVGIIASHTLGDLFKWNTKNLQILSPTGWKKIKNIWQIEKDKTIKFQVGSSSEIECSLDHKFPISHDNRRASYEIKTAGELRENPHRTLDRFLFVPIEKFLDKENFIEDAYKIGKFIGLIVAEGGFTHKYPQGKITLHKKEKELADFFIEILVGRFEIKPRHRFVDNYQSIEFYSEDLRKFYNRFCQGKCKEKKLDMVAILNSERDFRKGLFDGIIAGDGFISKEGRITYASASKQLRDDVYLLASSVGLLASRYRVHKQFDKRTGKIYESYFLTIPQSLQKEFKKGERECIKGKPLSAKYENVFSAKTLKFSRPEVIKKNKFLIDIEVEGGLFLINGGIVSHNSVKDRVNMASEHLFHFVKSSETQYWTNEKTGEITNKQPLGIHGKEGEDWDWIEHNVCKGLGCDNKRCVDGLIKRNHWEGHDYFYDIDAVRIPAQSELNYERPRMGGTQGGQTIYEKKRPDGIDREKNYPGAKRNKFAENYKYKGKFAGNLDAESFNSPRARTQRKEIKKLQVNDLRDKDGTIHWGSKGEAHPSKNPRWNPACGKNIPNNWLIGTEPSREHHFAKFPSMLCRIPILATCPKKVCKKCGKAKERITIHKSHRPTNEKYSSGGLEGKNPIKITFGNTENKTLGWTDCGCNAGFRPGIVLDPFAGSGTALVVAKQLGRNYLGIELNATYVKLAEDKIKAMPDTLL